MPFKGRLMPFSQYGYGLFDGLFQVRLGDCPKGLGKCPRTVRAPLQQNQEKIYCENTKKRPLRGLLSSHTSYCAFVLPSDFSASLFWMLSSLFQKIQIKYSMEGKIQKKLNRFTESIKIQIKYSMEGKIQKKLNRFTENI